jgi:hypothetical protein
MVVNVNFMNKIKRLKIPLINLSSLNKGLYSHMKVLDGFVRIWWCLFHFISNKIYHKRSINSIPKLGPLSTLYQTLPLSQ